MWRVRSAPDWKRSLMAQAIVFLGPRGRQTTKNDRLSHETMSGRFDLDAPLLGIERLDPEVQDLSDAEP